MKTKKKTGLCVATPFLLAVLVVGFNACGSHRDSGLVETLDGCDQYETAYLACATKLGAASFGEEHAAITRKRFRSDAKDEASRKRVKEACIESARRIVEACR